MGPLSAPKQWGCRAAAALLLLGHSSAVQGQAGNGRQADSAARQPAPVEAVSPQSPRAALAEYLTLSRTGRFDEAGAYLAAPRAASVDERTALARHLKAVLDRHVWFDLDEISAAPGGDPTDGLAANLEQIATIPGPDGTRQPVRLIRADSNRWVFTQATVERVPGWYAALGDHWLREHLPPALLQPGPFEILWWQWLALPAMIGTAIVVGSLAGNLIRRGLNRIASRTTTAWDDALLESLGSPIRIAGALAVAAAILPVLLLNPPAAALAYRLIRGGSSLVVLWSLWRAIDVAHLVVAKTPWAIATASSRSLMPLGARVAKAGVVAFAAVVALSILGFPVTSLLAGIGLGGLALALAAQKTVENLFGAFAIGIDQPFREGDFVKIDDFVGTVEAIGIRSTRFRTLDRTLISIPNGQLADSRLESFTARDRIRLAAVIGVVYETTAGQMRVVLAGLERVLRAHPKIWPDAVVVRFREFAASSLDIEIMAWFETADWAEFQEIRQEVLLQFMEVVEAAGTGFAFPTQTIHVAAPGAVGPARVTA